MKSRLLFSGLLIAILATVIACIPPKVVRVTRYQLRWNEPGAARIVQLSDLHLGWGTPDDLIEQAISQTQKAEPDLVVLTGDYLNRSLKRLPDLKRLASRLPRPCIAVMGNHDHWAGVAEIQTVLEDEGIIVLRNRSTRVNLGRLELMVVGVDDSSTNHDDLKKAFAGVRWPQDALVLTHSPGIADEIAEVGGCLILAGHTHGGQFDIPKVTLPIASLFGLKYLMGWYRLGDSRLYVNSGVGSPVIRQRIGRRVQPELTVIDLFTRWSDWRGDDRSLPCKLERKGGTGPEIPRKCCTSKQLVCRSRLACPLLCHCARTKENRA